MKKIFVTGAAGYLGTKVVRRLLKREGFEVHCSDLRFPDDYPSEAVLFPTDIRGSEIAQYIAQGEFEVVIHLAAIVGAGVERSLAYAVDVEGTRNVLDACVQGKVKRFVNTSSGAAYGYYEDNADWLTEDDPIRGNPEFAYSDHKRLVEEMLSDFRKSQPQLEQVVFRVGTILGVGVENQITNLFDQKRILGIVGCDSPFVFIWDEDVARAIEYAVDSPKTGVYNLAGDGALSMPEIAKRLGKPYLALPAWLVKAILTIANPLGLVRYGPEQVRFIQYRPVLLNTRIKDEYGFIPEKTSSEVFEFFLAQR